MSNIVQSLQNLITPELLGKAAVKLGESSDSISKAGKGIVASLLAEVVEGGENSRMDRELRQAGDSFSSISASLGDIFDGNISDSAKSIGANFLGLTLGDKLGDFSALISKDYKLGTGSTNSLIGMIAPVVSSGLGNIMKTQSLDINGLIKGLADEKDSIIPSIPNGMAKILGLGSLTLLGNKIISGASNLATGVADGAAGAVSGAADAAAGAVSGVAKGASNALGGVADGAADAVSDVAKGASNVVGGVADGAADLTKGAVKTTSSFLSWLLPLLLVIGGVLLLIAVWRSCGDKDKGDAATSGDNIENVDSTSTDSSATDANAGEKVATQVTLPSGATIDAFKGGIEDQMVNFLNSDDYKNATEEELKEKWFNFDEVNFIFGSNSELTPESEKQISNVIAIMKEYPEAKIKLGAYTDKVGDDANNKALSQKRADYLAKRLGDAGIAGQITGAEGYGEKYAKVAEDASDEERAADRHMSLRFTKGGE